MRVIRVTGAAINAAIIIIGGVIGLLFRGRISEKISATVTRAIGLCVCVIGVSGALAGDIMLLVVSLMLGSVTGELINIDGRLNDLGTTLQKKISRGGRDSRFAEGFVTTTLLFCVGAMAVVGSIESGLSNDQSVIVTKSILDGTTAMVFASSLGAGVLFSAVSVFVYQGAIEFFAGVLASSLTEGLVAQISAAGSVMILGIGLGMAANVKIRIANLLPGLLFAAGYYFVFMGSR